MLIILEMSEKCILSHETVASIEANLLISLYLTYYVCDIHAFKKLEKSRTLKVCCLSSDIAVLNHPFLQKKYFKLSGLLNWA